MLWFGVIQSGVTLSLHYCHGSLENISISLVQSKAHCSMQDQWQDNHCCHTEKHFFQNTEPSQSNLVLEWQASALSVPALPNTELSYQSAPQSNYPLGRAPPGPPRPAWKYLSVFLS